MECFGRDGEAADLIGKAKAGKNLLLLAPRRIGKTVLLNHLKEDATNSSLQIVLLDVEGFRDEKWFFRALCSEIQGEFSSGSMVMTAFGHRLDRLFRGGDASETRDWRQWLLQVDWQDFANHLLAHLDEHAEGAPWLILVDELPIFVLALLEDRGVAAVRQFLYSLRAMRQKYPQVRWIYTGSIGLDAISRHHNIEGALNDLISVTLEDFDEATAHAFICHLAMRRGRVIEADARQAIINRLGWLSPYYLERVFEAASARSYLEITPAIVHLAMDDLLEVGSRMYWAAWREHLERNFSSPEKGRLYAALEVIARSENGASFNAVLAAMSASDAAVDAHAVRAVVDTLMADGYLRQVQGVLLFRMRLLREWWLRYVV